VNVGTKRRGADAVREELRGVEVEFRKLEKHTDQLKDELRELTAVAWAIMTCCKKVNCYGTERGDPVIVVRAISLDPEVSHRCSQQPDGKIRLLGPRGHMIDLKIDGEYVEGYKLFSNKTAAFAECESRLSLMRLHCSYGCDACPYSL